MFTSFEATFERYYIKRDGAAILEFKISAMDLAKVVHTLAVAENTIRIVSTVIEKKDITFELTNAMFEKLDVYREGNSRIKFTTLPVNLKGLDNINEFVEMNLKVEIYRLE